MRIWGRRGREPIVVGFATTYATVPITTKVESSNPTQDTTLCDKICH